MFFFTLSFWAFWYWEHIFGHSKIEDKKRMCANGKKWKSTFVKRFYYYISKDVFLSCQIARFFYACKTTNYELEITLEKILKLKLYIFKLTFKIDLEISWNFLRNTRIHLCKIIIFLGMYISWKTCFLKILLTW